MSWQNISLPAPGWSSLAMPAAAVQVLIPVGQRVFVVWDPLIDKPISSSFRWDDGATNWIS